MRILLNLLITAIVAYALTYILSGIHFDGFSGAIIFAIVLGVLNLIVTPILKILGLPLTIITLGLLLAAKFVSGMSIDGFLTAFIFSILLSIITSLLSGIFTSKD